MPKCFIPLCKSGYSTTMRANKANGKPNESIFMAPKDDTLLEKWRRAIPRADKVFSSSDGVCERHFDEGDIERAFTKTISDGSIFQLTRIRPRLKKGAIPCLFPKLPVYLSKIHQESDTQLIRFQKEQYNDLNVPEMTQETFHDFQVQVQHMTKPSSMWLVNSLSTYTALVNWNKNYGINKIVIVTDNLNVKVYVKGKEVTQFASVVTDISDFQELLERIDRLILCPGLDSFTTCMIMESSPAMEDRKTETNVDNEQPTKSQKEKVENKNEPDAPQDKKDIKEELCDDESSFLNASESYLTENENATSSDAELNDSLDGEKSEVELDMSKDDETEDQETSVTSEVPKRKRRRGMIYDLNLDPDSLVEKKKSRAVELKLKNLKWTLNQPCEVTGKRQKKAPDRFELALLSKRKSSMDDGEGDGDPLGTIPWIVQHVRDANLYTLRLLHRVIFRKQGMFSEKHIRRSVMTFKGFPFDLSSSEVEKRKMPMEKATASAIAKLCDILAIKISEKNEMINAILKFLHRPSRQQVEDFLQDPASLSLRHKDMKDSFRIQLPSVGFSGYDIDAEEDDDMAQINMGQLANPLDNSLLTMPWVKPTFFSEGKGIKLKCFKPIVANVQVATHSFIEMLHRLLFLYVDSATNQKRNILEFNGISSPVGSPDFIYRNKLLFGLPLEQIKLVCRVLCLPTWHRSRQYLIDGIMNFLASPCLTAMKKTVPAPASANATSTPMSTTFKKEELPNIKVEMEEIEIVPDIHIPDDDFLLQCREESPVIAPEEQMVKLRNFPNIHYQIVSTPASKLNDLHMVLYGRPCPLNNVRKNILEFSCFPFKERSEEYEGRQAILEQMGLDSLITIVTVLSLTPYVADLSRVNIIEAVLKFLLKPSALLNTDKLSNPVQTCESIKNISLNVLLEEKNRMNLDLLGKTGEITIQPINPPHIEIRCPSPTRPNHNFANKANKRKSQPPVKVISNTSPVVVKIKTEPTEISSADSEPSFGKAIKFEPPVSLNEDLESDENDDEPLSKFIGHPNDDQLRTLVAKIVKESVLDNITMKYVIKTVFHTYPNYDLTYRKEFIKSVVRQILSQMDESRCTVSTTVLTF